jgi:hypothetical protein
MKALADFRSLSMKSKLGKLMRLSEVAKSLPIKISRDGVYRWATKGVRVNRRVIRLEVVLIGGTIYTCNKWLDAFNNTIRKLRGLPTQACRGKLRKTA